MAKKIDLKDLKLIDAKDVPKAKMYSVWAEILNSIPEGKALDIPHEVINQGTVRAALSKRHRLGKYKHIRFSYRTINGKKIGYLINSEDED